MDEATFAAFYETTRRALWSYVYGLTDSVEEANDLVQECYLRFLVQPPRRLEERAMKSYLYRTATRLVYDRSRRARRRREMLDERSREHGRETAPDENLDLRQDVARIFSHLSERERSLMWLAYVERYPHREIAEITGLKEGSIRVLLHRARRSVADRLEKAGLSSRDLP